MAFFLDFRPFFNEQMSFFQLHQKLNQVAEFQLAFPPDDRLSALIRQYGTGEELDSEELEWVSAAGSGPDYQSFLKLAQERKRRE